MPTPPRAPGAILNARKCGHAFCKECLRKSRKKPRPCLSCGTVPTSAKVGSDECYNHDMNQFQQLLRTYCEGPSLTAKGNKRVRNPGDDEFGLQPRLARPRATKRPKGGAGKGRKKNGRRSRQGAKKNDTTKRIQINASGFLRECDKKPWSPIPHSAKTAAALGLVKQW